MVDNFKKLTDLQGKAGYKKTPKGVINPIGLFGLFGEAGEVLGEVSVHGSELASLIHETAVRYGVKVDDLKKAIRSGNINGVTIKIKNVKAFDEELGDLVYYANLLAKNRGKTLNQYAGMAVRKSKRKIKKFGFETNAKKVVGK